MAKSQGRVRKSTWLLISLILIFLCVFSCMTLVYFYVNTNRLTNINEQLKKDIDTFNKIKEDNQSKLEHLSVMYKEVEDVDVSLKEVKESYFKLAKEADERARNGADFKVCYLTFDDGPYSKTTSLFLDVLKEKNVLGTFFVLKKDNLDDLYRRIRDEGHTLANHTASHKISNGIYRSEETFIDDIKENDDFIYNLLGVKMDVMRFPGGSPQATYSGLNKSSLVNKLVDMGYGYIDWTLTTGDGEANLSPDEFLHNVVDKSSKYSVMTVLMHDYSKNTALCLGDMIDILREQGYIFLPLSYDSPAVRKS
ncbi:MAG: polysaccharide deacetylase family protein [Erysipelotrichaceae bacterium]|nr:polysaccharide deacetylase family protein [Erysipelotrichaceae bacterium]